MSAEPPRGEGRALLDALYHAHRRRLYAFLWARVGSREDALDLLQEVYLRAWRHVGTLAELPEERRLYWLFACARRLGIDHHRHRQVVARTEGPPPADPPDTGGGEPGRRLEAAETWRVLDAAIRSLPADLREVLALSVLGGATSAEIGAALGIPAGTVRYRLMRARRLLQEHVASTAAGPGRDAR